jgi:hypothetical protein
MLDAYKDSLHSNTYINRFKSMSMLGIRTVQCRLDYLEESDEVVAYFPEGRVQGPWISNEDSQSESVDNSSSGIQEPKLLAAIDFIMKQAQIHDSWALKKDSLVEESIADEEQVNDSLGHPNIDAVPHWTPQHLACELLNLQAPQDISRLRALILAAEDTAFSPEDSERLAPWLLNYALQRSV